MRIPIRCKVGVHTYGRAHYTDHGIHSNVRDYKQKCQKCGKLLFWTQPKGVDYRYYPAYWQKRNLLVYLLFFIAFLMMIWLLFNQIHL